VVGHQVEKEMTTATKFFVDIEGILKPWDKTMNDTK